MTEISNVEILPRLCEHRLIKSSFKILWLISVIIEMLITELDLWVFEFSYLTIYFYVTIKSIHWF